MTLINDEGEDEKRKERTEQSKIRVAEKNKIKQEVERRRSGKKNENSGDTDRGERRRVRER